NVGNNKNKRSKKARVSYKVHRTINSNRNTETNTIAVTSSPDLVAHQNNERITGQQHDVLGLDVAMHDVVVVRIRERVGDFARDLQRIVHRQLWLAVEPVA